MAGPKPSSAGRKSPASPKTFLQKVAVRVPCASHPPGESWSISLSPAGTTRGTPTPHSFQLISLIRRCSSLQNDNLTRDQTRTRVHVRGGGGIAKRGPEGGLHTRLSSDNKSRVLVGLCGPRWPGACPPRSGGFQIPGFRKQQIKTLEESGQDAELLRQGSWGPSS